jgi:hypothetical protein
MTTPDFTRYVPPGVYVQDTTTPIVTTTGLPPSVVAVLGPALGYQTATETALVYASTGTVLDNKGIFTTAQTGPPAISAPVVRKLDSTLLTVNTDYTFVVDSSGPGGTAGAVTSIQRVSNSPNISDGQAVTITYNYADTTYYTPQSHTDFDTIMSVYGLPMVTTAPSNPNATQIASPLSMAAQMAIQNGTSTLITLALNPSDGDLRAQFQAAYGKIATSYSTTVIVPALPDDLTVSSGTVAAYTQLLAQDLNSHCTNASNAGYTRIGFFGAPRNYSEADLTQESLAGAISSRRFILVYPHNMLIFNSATNQITTVGGAMVAAAVAGRLSSLPVNTGLTKQVITGFQGIPTSVLQGMTKAYKDSLSSHGVCVAELNRLNQLLIRHGVTTDMSSLDKREISMIRISDTLYNLVQLGMESAGLIGQPIDADMSMRVKAALSSILEQAKATEVIVDYANLKVMQQASPSGDPTIINCKFSYQPALPLNYVTVQFQVDLTTGVVSDTTTTA